MRTKVNILLLSASFCFASMKTTDVLASFDSASDDPIHLFKSSALDIDIAKTYDSCSLKGTLTDIAKKSAHNKNALSSVRLSNRATIQSRRGLGGSYLNFNERKDYREFYMLGDGNCGLYSAGTNHADANALLLANAGNADVRRMAHHEIFDIFNSNDMNRLPSQIVDTPRYRQLTEDLSTQEVLLLTNAVQAHVAMAEKERLVAEWAQEEQTFTDYVTYGLVDGNFMDYGQDLVEQNHFGHNVFTTRTYFLDTILFLMHKNLRVWQQTDHWGVPVDNRPGDQTQHQMQLFHDQVHNPAWETVDLIHRGIHYNRVVPTDNADALDQALADEERHLETYAYITMNMGMANRYKKVLNGVMGDLSAKSNTPTSMKTQAAAYQHAYTSDAELQKATRNISINDTDKTISQIVLSRAYALKAKELEQKQNRSADETTKMTDYKAKADALKRQIPEEITQDMIDIEAMQMYQYARADKNMFEDAGIAATAHPVASLAYEIDEIVTALYKSTDKFLRTKQDDARYAYLKKFNKAQADYLASEQKYRHLSLGYSHEWNDSHQEAVSAMDDIARTKRATRQAYLNPELIKKDPYLSVWNVSIDQDSNYANELTRADFSAINDEVKNLIDKVIGWEQVDRIEAKDNMDRVWSTTNSTLQEDTTQAKLLKRRVKRIYDTFLSQGEGKTAEAKKVDGASKFALAITANPYGCITGQEEVVKTIEDGLFGATEALTAGAKISKIIINDRQQFIYDHGKSFKMDQAQEPHLNIPVLLNKRLSVAFSLGLPVTSMYAIGCGRPSELTLKPNAVVDRYLNGGSLKVENYYGTPSTRVDFEARTPDYIADKLLKAYERSHKKSVLGKRSNTGLGKDKIQDLRRNGTATEKNRYSEDEILRRANANGRTQDAVEREKIIVFGQSAYEAHVKQQLKNTLKPIHAENWKDYFSHNKDRLIQEYSQTQGAAFGLDAQAYQNQQIQFLGRSEFQAKSAEQAGEPLYTALVKRASEANLRLAHGANWEDEWDDQQDDLIEQYSQNQGGLLGMNTDAYKQQEIQRLGNDHIRRTGTNQYKIDTWKEVILDDAYEKMGLSIKADLNAEIALHGELSIEDLEAFIHNDPTLNAEYTSDDYVVMFDDTKHFIAGGGADQFRPEFFMYMLKKFGYVIDPNNPVDSYLGASDAENKAYIDQVDDARNAEFAKMMNISTKKARNINTIRQEIAALQTQAQSRTIRDKIDALEREIDPSRPRHVQQPAPYVPSVQQPAPYVPSVQQPAPYVPSVQQPVPYVPSVQQPAPSMSVSQITSSGVSIQQQIEMLEALPSSRATNNALIRLRQALENPGSASPLISSPSAPSAHVPAPIYSVSSRASVPSVQQPAPYVPNVQQPAPSMSASQITSSGVSIQQQIEMLEALPSSRVTNLKLAQLRQSLLNAGSAGLPSMQIPLSSSGVSGSVLGISAAAIPQPVVPSVLPSVYVPAPRSSPALAPSSMTREQIVQEIANLERQPSSRLINTKLSRLRAQLATL